MKSGIHPKYIETSVECGCGNSFTTRSTVEKIQVEVCSSCHPFYTGKQKFVDTAGRVEKFAKRFQWQEGSTDKVISGAEAKREQERLKIQAQEEKQRDDLIQKKKSNEERRQRLLEQKKKEAEAKAAEAAAAAEAAEGDKPADAEKPAEGEAPKAAAPAEGEAPATGANEEPKADA